LVMERVGEGIADKFGDAAGRQPIIDRRSAVVAATLSATIAIWAIALWAWLGGGSPGAALPDRAVVAAHTPSGGGAAERDAQQSAPPQPAPLTAMTAGRDAQAAPAEQYAPSGSRAARQAIEAPPSSPQKLRLANDRAADETARTPPVPQSPPAASLAVGVASRPPVRTTLEIDTAVVRGGQSSAASDNGTAVVRGNQAPATPAPDSGPAVVRGIRPPAGPSSQ
jgi:hypothetical protein